MSVADDLVSVVIIFLDGGPFLEEAVASVFAQTYDRWELLLVDDGSTDGSTEYARSVAAAHPDRVRYHEHPGHENRGMSASRNLGVAEARGTYVSYLDADDVWLAHKLERQVALLAEHPTARMVYGPLTRWYSWTGRPEDAERDDRYGLQGHRFRLSADRLYEPPELLVHILRHKDLIPAGILVERAVLLEVGGGEDEFRGNYEDAVVLVKLCLVNAVYCSSESWYLYRQHDPTARRGGPQRRARDQTREDFLRWVEAYLGRHAPDDRVLRRSVRAARRPYRYPRTTAAWARVRGRLGTLRRAALAPLRPTPGPSGARR